MIIVKRTQSPIALKLELEWVMVDNEKQETIAYFYDEQPAIIAARALNKQQKSASRKP
jgi:hypothetical protein